MVFAEIQDHGRRRDDSTGFCVVFGILQAGTKNVLLALFIVVGAVFLAAFFLYIRSRERAGKEPLLPTGLFKNRTCNLALVTQNIQWLILMGTSLPSPSSSRKCAATARSPQASSSLPRPSAS